MTIIAGIDYSYTSPAICVYDTSKELTFENLTFYNFSEKKKLQGRHGPTQNVRLGLMQPYNSPEERYRNICNWASLVLFSHNVEEACIEGYSFGASAGLVFNIAENGSLIKQFMSLKNIPFTSPTPSQVKKRFSSKGNSKKDVMVARFHTIFPHVKLHEILGIKEMAKPIDDIVDSFAVLLCHKYFDGNDKIYE